MKKFAQNGSNKINRLKKKVKCQSNNTRYKSPNQKCFQFKSSLFTEKNKSLIEKLVSLSVSPENSFSKEESKEKENNKKDKLSIETKSKNAKTEKKNRICHQKILQDNKKKIFCKKIFKDKNNSTVSYVNKAINNINTSITDCQIEPIKKKNYKVKFSKNESIEKKKVIFNGINNFIRNGSVKTKINSNLNCSTKNLYERKKLNKSMKIGSVVNKRNSINNKNNINIITVNTINLKNRAKNINNLKLIKNKIKPKKIMINEKNKNTIYCHKI